MSGKHEVDGDSTTRLYDCADNAGEVEVVSTSKISRFERICVFCGSSSGRKDVFTNEALNLGRELVKRQIDLVYGGGSIGLMGQLAHTVNSGGGHVVGVIPKALIGQEITGSTVGELIVVPDMHQRKAEMARQADAFIALPGGYGTLEELVEVITWNQLGIHLKPVGLLNVDGFYDTLLTFFDKQLEEEFFDNSARSIVVSAATASELLDKLELFVLDPSCVGRWTGVHPWGTAQAPKLDGLYSPLIDDHDWAFDWTIQVTESQRLVAECMVPVHTIN